MLTHHQPVAEQEEHHCPNAEIHQVFHNNVACVLSPGEAGLYHGETALHKKHQNRTDQKPYCHIRQYTSKKGGKDLCTQRAASLPSNMSVIILAENTEVKASDIQISEEKEEGKPMILR